MKRAWLLTLFSLSVIAFTPAAFANDTGDSFSYYYNSYVPMNTYEDEVENTSGSGLQYKPTPGTYEYEKEVEYLYGRNVLGYNDGESRDTGGMVENDGTMPYGWSLKAPIN